MLALRANVYAETVDGPSGHLTEAGYLAPGTPVRHVTETIDGVTYYEALTANGWEIQRSFPLRKAELAVVRS